MGTGFAAEAWTKSGHKLWQRSVGCYYIRLYPQLLRFCSFLVLLAWIEFCILFLWLVQSFPLGIFRAWIVPYGYHRCSNLAMWLWFCRRRWRTWMNTPGALATSVGLKSDMASSHTDDAWDGASQAKSAAESYEKILGKHSSIADFVPGKNIRTQWRMKTKDVLCSLWHAGTLELVG